MAAPEADTEESAHHASGVAPGPTVVVDQRFDNGRMCASPEDPQRCALIYPRRGAFAVFDGGLGHGVIGSAAADLRATLLINWWPHQPQVGMFY